MISIQLDSIRAASKEHPAYSGRPEEYVDLVLQAVTFYPSWPSFARWMIEKQLTGKTEEEGTKLLTAMLVNDSTGNLQMKKFSAQDKKSIVEACLARKEYGQEVQNQVGKLFLLGSKKEI